MNHGDTIISQLPTEHACPKSNCKLSPSNAQNQAYRGIATQKHLLPQVIPSGPGPAKFPGSRPWNKWKVHRPRATGCPPRRVPPSSPSSARRRSRSRRRCRRRCRRRPGAPAAAERAGAASDVAGTCRGRWRPPAQVGQILEPPRWITVGLKAGLLWFMNLW